jgi:hypothetical protein
LRPVPLAWHQRVQQEGPELTSRLYARLYYAT